MPDMTSVVGRCDVLLLTIDTLRYDVAQQELHGGGTPCLARELPPEGWELRHSPGSFTYASHWAFFAGFLPTPAVPGRHERLFSLRFSGSETTGAGTHVFDTPDIVSGFAGLGYRTVCIGGVGFFKKENPLSQVLPSLFQESHWRPEFGVTDPHSTRHQVECACRLLDEDPSRPTFLFLNVSALHQPNRFYLEGEIEDSVRTHAAALRYVDGELPALFDKFRQRPRDTFVIACSDHGTCYGEGGFTGHRLAHEAVWNVPYATFLLKGTGNG